MGFLQGEPPEESLQDMQRWVKTFDNTPPTAAIRQHKSIGRRLRRSTAKGSQIMEKRPPNQAKEQLSNYLALKGKKEAILRTIETLREQAMKITMELKPDRVKNSPAIHDPIAEAAAKIADAEKALEAAAQDATAAMNETVQLILSVDGDKLQTLLLLRYIQGEQWDAIAHALHYERRQIHRMHGQALEQINRRQNRGTANDADG